jgi:hypothetical protein
LNERRSSVVGTAQQKVLSGGERKRLNIGLDMISSADVYLFDEPTSGLSSKDSEHVIEIIRAMSHNKLVMVTIHQPTARVFQMFHKVLLLDKGGKVVFFGTPHETLQYFADAEHLQHFGTVGKSDIGDAARPEFIFDVLETPLRDLSGDIIFEENNRGQLVPARRYSPDYWRDKYEAYRLVKDVRTTAVAAREPAGAAPPAPMPALQRRREPLRWREEWGQFRTLFARAFISKVRNRANLLITLLVAPTLALLIGFVLRYAESGNYDFASAFHIPTYLFLSLVVAMFLGLTNSVDDVTRDRPILLRERNLNVRLSYYVAAKALTLAFFGVIQCVLYAWVGDALLEVRGMFWIVFLALFLTVMSGVAIGLVVSALVNESKTAVLFIPVVLIPQIILSGALIKYEEMNRDLDFAHAAERWFEKHPDSAQKPRSDLMVPLICELMPMRWSYEALVYAQAKLNPLTRRQDRIQREIAAVAARRNENPDDEQRLDDLKDVLALVSGLRGKTPGAIDRSFQKVDEVIDGAPFDPRNFGSQKGSLTAEQLYVNQKVTDLISKAEMEQFDYRHGREHLNVFFGPVKEYFGVRVNVLIFNAGVLVVTTLACFFALYFILQRQIGLRGP